MGIRVDAYALRAQAAQKGEALGSNPYNHAILDDELPFSIGGGIGKSRIAMFMLNRAHIGEIQASYWPTDHRAECAKHGIDLL